MITRGHRRTAPPAGLEPRKQPSTTADLSILDPDLNSTGHAVGSDQLGLGDMDEEGAGTWPVAANPSSSWHSGRA